MATTEEILKQIREVSPTDGLEENTELIRSGILDSVGIMSLTIALTSAFGVQITPAELKEENFRTPLDITALVNRLEDEG